MKQFAVGSNTILYNYILLIKLILIFIDPMEVYRQRANSEVDILSWVDKNHPLTDIKRLQYWFIIIPSFVNP